MVGMGGAYRAIAEGPPAQRVNPAAIVVAPTYADPDTWRWNGLFILRTLVPLVETLDLNPLRDAPLPTAEVSAGVLVRKDVHAGVLRVDWRSQADEETGQSVLLSEISAGYGLALADERLHLGVVPGVLIVRANPVSRRGLTALPTLGVGARLDVPDSPVRVGASFYAPAASAVADPQVERLRLPWEGGLGLALRRGRAVHGSRVHPDVLSEDGAAPAHWTPGEPWFVQIAVDATVYGAMKDVASIEAWTRGEPVGTDVPVQMTLALGVETAPLPYHLRVRAGVYSEPQRARTSRDGVIVHGTLGADVALFEWPRQRWRWRLTPVLDVSAVEVRPGLGLGLW